uniref:Uncharacterized protein n=1 Tax=Anser brachyrhynchus TaxID=132585 RepID=A0A8B9D1Z4_9AVES
APGRIPHGVGEHLSSRQPQKHTGGRATAQKPGAVRGCGSGTALCGPCQPPRASLEPRAATAQLRPLSAQLELSYCVCVCINAHTYIYIYVSVRT